MIREVIATAPTRVDLAGGTLDLWPLSQLVDEAVTVNLALDVRAGCSIAPGGNTWRLAARGGESMELSSLPDRPEREVPGPLALAAVVAAHGRLPPCRIETWSDAPPGSGLGGSSALVIALLAASCRLRGISLDDGAAVDLACNLETRVLGLPGGSQDHWAAQCGGLSVLRYGPGGVTRTEAVSAAADLGPVLVVADTQVQHHSGMNNWAVFKAFLEGEGRTRTALGDVSAAARAMAAAVLDDLSRPRRIEAARRALDDEWQARRRLAPQVSSPEVEAVIAAARGAGAAAKVCGAGGGGCVACLASSAADRSRVAQAVTAAGARVLPASLSRQGVLVEVRD
jgi:D-glycero-alpha-D-manno-heptose-7-phosphate kinase